MFISISITSFNRKELTEFCIKSLKETTQRDMYELIVVDNRSTDGAVNLLTNLKEEGDIDKLILNPENYHLGKATNQAIEAADQSAEWLLMIANDHFFMKNWLRNFKLVGSDLKVDYLHCIYLQDLINNKLLPRVATKTKRGGVYMKLVPLKNMGDRKRYTKVLKRGWEYGGGIAIKKEIVDKFKIRFLEKPFSRDFVGPVPELNERLFKYGLKGAKLGKPCILVQDDDFLNPKYKEYYETTFSRRGITKWLKIYKKCGHFRNPEQYYKGTDYLERIEWKYRRAK